MYLNELPSESDHLGPCANPIKQDQAPTDKLINEAVAPPPHHPPGKSIVR